MTAEGAEAPFVMSVTSSSDASGPSGAGHRAAADRNPRLSHNDAVVHLDAETFVPVGVSKPCRSSVVAHLGVVDPNGSRLWCGLLAGHEPKPHVFHIEWTDPSGPVPSLKQRMDASQARLRLRGGPMTAPCPSCDRDLTYRGQPGHDCYTSAEHRARIAANEATR